MTSQAHDGPAGARTSNAPTNACVFRDFGGLVIAIDSADRSWREQAWARFREGKTRREPDLWISYTPTQDTTPPAERLRWGRMQPMETQTEAGIVTFRHPEFSARFHPEQRILSISGTRATYPLDLLLMELWYVFVPNGLIVHAAVLADQNKGFVCAGSSGSGKSTLAKLLPQYARCEELAAIIADDGTFRVRTLPFWREKPGSFELAAIHVLEHGSQNRCRRQTPKAASALLRRQIAWPMHDPKILQTALSTFCSLVSQTPVFRLAFRPEASVWPVICQAS